MTVTAAFKKIPPVVTPHTVKVNAAENGSVTADKTTANAQDTIDAIGEWAGGTGVSGFLASVTKNAAVSLLKEHMDEVDWEVADTLKGEDRADVVIGFDYNDGSITGTIDIILIREDNAWKIDSLGNLRLNSLSLN